MKNDLERINKMLSLQNKNSWFNLAKYNEQILREKEQKIAKKLLEKTFEKLNKEADRGNY